MRAVLSSRIFVLSLQRRAMLKRLQEFQASREYRERKCRNDSVWVEYEKDRGRKGDEY